MAKEPAKADAVHELKSSAADAISCMRFSPSGNWLAVGSWDCGIHLYQRVDGEKSYTPHSKYSVFPLPVLDLCWGDSENSIYQVGLHCCVFRLDWDPEAGTAQGWILSAHEDTSNKVVYSREHGIVLSTSWDGTMNVHHPEIIGSFIRVRLPRKPYAISLTPERAVVAMADRKVSVYDLHVLKTLVDEAGDTAARGREIEILDVQPWQERESSLKFMTRAVACMIDGAGFATSSIEGRVGVEWFDPEEQKKTYAFKCHRQTEKQTNEEGVEEEIDIIYPVNALAFHPVHGTFATGGGDGVVALWDAQTKRRVRQYPKLDANIVALDFSPDGKFLATGVTPLPLNLLAEEDPGKELNERNGAEDGLRVEGGIEVEGATTDPKLGAVDDPPEGGNEMEGVETEQDDDEFSRTLEGKTILELLERPVQVEMVHYNKDDAEMVGNGQQGQHIEENSAKQESEIMKHVNVFVRELGDSEAKPKAAKSKPSE